MQTITRETGATLMAQWMATGGALDAAGHEDSRRDDGLKGGRSTDLGCFADDGLQATGPTQDWRRCL